GYKPGIISRGYGGKARSWPQQVRPDADPVMVGDEAVLISRRTGCPMAVGPNRIADCQALLEYADVDVIISDDGLQHYALGRTVEIAVIDGVRRFGNGFCLPAGPLRELRSRLETVDCRVTNGVAAQGEIPMRYQADIAINLLSGEQRQISDFRNQPVHAVAGIGNPDRFFNFIRGHGIRSNTCAFPDHHYYTADELDFAGNDVLLMTEKDAVKCQRFARENWWYVPVDAVLPEEFGLNLIHLLEERHG
ncbi:MAG: tetraacyldisaccharide 4'-kinase, partial [Gammaproteobacteria bacterium]